MVKAEEEDRFRKVGVAAVDPLRLVMVGEAVLQTMVEEGAVALRWMAREVVEELQ